ncbi:MAG: type VI secretion system accessory protein TagJ [Candidatus Competibacteraceae bacterium]
MSLAHNLRAGTLQETLAQLQTQVRKDPANARPRIFLFQLLAVLGQWERALNQLQVCGTLDAGALPMVQTYREALRCEVFRAEVFAGRRAPLVFGDPEHWVALLLEALQLTAQGQDARSQALREQAFEAAPPTSGRIDDQPFQWIADADSRLGPTLEAIVNGRYYWIPFHRIHRIQIEPPADLRDLVWTPARFTWANGGETVGLIPTRYPGSESRPDDGIRLARKTDWTEAAAGLYLGLGQRMLATDNGEYALLDTRLITLDTVAAQSASAVGEFADG